MIDRLENLGHRLILIADRLHVRWLATVHTEDETPHDATPQIDSLEAVVSAVEAALHPLQNSDGGHPRPPVELRREPAKIRMRETLMARTRDLDPETLVLRVPPGMAALSAHVTRTEEGQAIIYWSGWAPPDESPLSGSIASMLGCGVLGCFLGLRAAVELGDTRVLVGEGEGVWMVATIEGRS